ncbi:MAG: type I CRISPR-associated protein Cas7 [Elusimicrobiota bacterium]|nr:type I CRISPR-associated protein Cas7 [Endomicrobiia bacterium]MDW8166375.1 type I CRISPR-associated protein Cas7 [Elusimicrobiota bacterium]
MIKNRSEILFIYDVRDCNPNGDPGSDEPNYPRIDESDGKCWVSDLRLKRTIRDYLHNYLGEEIFFREILLPDGTLGTRESIWDAYNGNLFDVLKSCIDIRCFGGVFPLSKKKEAKDDKDKKTKAKKKEKEQQIESKSLFNGDNEIFETTENATEEKEASAAIAVQPKTNFHLTGPIQFAWGKTYHAVEVIRHEGTSVLPSKENKMQGTITTSYKIPYGLIGFYGVVNENIVVKEHFRILKSYFSGQKTDEEIVSVLLSQKDLDKMLFSLWFGTKTLKTTSKMQSPRLLIQIVYHEGNLDFIGDLDRKITIKITSPTYIANRIDAERKIRNISDVALQMDKLLYFIDTYAPLIKEIRLIQDKECVCLYCDEPVDISEYFKSKSIAVINLGDIFSQFSQKNSN